MGPAPSLSSPRRPSRRLARARRGRRRRAVARSRGTRVDGRSSLHAGSARRGGAAARRDRRGLRRRGGLARRSHWYLSGAATLRTGARDALSAGAGPRAGEPLVPGAGAPRRRHPPGTAAGRGAAGRRGPGGRAARRERARRPGRLLPLRPRALGRPVADADGRGPARGPRPWSRLPLELAPRGALAQRAGDGPDVAGPHVVDHGRRGYRRLGAAGDGGVGGRALSGRPLARAADRYVGRRHVRATLRSPRGDAVHAPGAGVRRSPSLPARSRRARACSRPADLHGPRRARLGGPGLRRPYRARGPAGRRRAARLPGDRGPVPPPPPGRKTHKPPLAACRERYGLRITRVAAVPVFLPCHSANAKALLTSASGKLCETTFESGYLSFVRTRRSSALGMIHGL